MSIKNDAVSDWPGGYNDNSHSEPHKEDEKSEPGPDKTEKLKKEWDIPVDDAKIVSVLSDLLIEKGVDKTILRIVNDAEGGVITTMEVKESLGCSFKIASNLLENLRDEGVLGKRDTGDTEIWWLVENSTPITNSNLDVPEELKNTLHKYKKDNENLEEAYERIKGNPSPEILREFVNTDSDFGKKIGDVISNRSDTDIEKKKKDRLRNRFK